MMKLVNRAALGAALVAITASAAQAHFPWLATDDDGRAVLFFSESPHETDYRLPEAVQKAKAFSRVGGKKAAELKIEPVEEEGFIGRRTKSPVNEGAQLEAAVSYGVYHGMLLDYYVKGLTAVSPEKWSESAESKLLRLNVTPRLTGEDIRAEVRWEGEPLAGVTVTMIDAEGETTEATTGDNGVAIFQKPAEGMVGFLANRMDREAKGTAGEDEYTSAGQYATVTVKLKKGGPDEAAPAPGASAEGDSAALPSLPEPLASFGAAVCDGWLYVYSGHTGEEHAHSRENLSGHFRRVKLENGAAWEELPMQTPLQGLPLAAHGGKLYRVGGLSARNAPGEADDLHSVAEFACFDPSTKTWTELAPLPERRSSHDAVVIGDFLYVVGGWTLSGSDKGEWLSTAWRFDLAQGGQWQPIAPPTFKRRALAVAEWNGKLAAIGGMDDGAKVSARVDLFDPVTDQWSELPMLPAGRLRGFGVSAWSLGDELFVNGAAGVVHRLAPGAKDWDTAGKLETPRFFHRLVPGDDKSLLAVAGASFSDGHLANIERFEPSRAN